MGSARRPALLGPIADRCPLVRVESSFPWAVALSHSDAFAHAICTVCVAPRAVSASVFAPRPYSCAVRSDPTGLSVELSSVFARYDEAPQHPRA